MIQDIKLNQIKHHITCNLTCNLIVLKQSIESDQIHFVFFPNSSYLLINVVVHHVQPIHYMLTIANLNRVCTAQTYNHTRITFIK